jgi:hypothetical protein
VSGISADFDVDHQREPRNTRNTRNIRDGENKLNDAPFIFDFRVVTEVHNSTKFVTRGIQVIVDLSAVDIVECLDCFEFTSSG